MALWLADIIVSLFSLAISLHFRFGNWGGAAWKGTSDIFVSVVLISTLISFGMNLDRNFMRRGWFDEMRAVFLHNAVLGVALILFYYFTHNSGSLSRLVFGYFLLINFAAMLVERGLIKYIAHRVYGKDTFRTPILVITDQAHSNDPFDDGLVNNVVGHIVIDAEYARGTIHNQPLSTTLIDLPKKLVTVAFDEVFINAPTLAENTVYLLMERFTEMGVKVHVVLNICQPADQQLTVSAFGGDYLCANYAKHEFNRAALAVKRIFDIIGALVGLAICGIIYIFAAPAIKLDSPGPVIFSQIRIGRNGKRFKFYKFRSMYIDAEERKKNLMAENEMNGLMFKMEDDPRITKVGKFMRKTSLDEFPQFWNVLKGDMSLVGTRPPTEDEFLHYNEHYRERLSIRPGITGLWQVSGRSDITNFDDVVKLDLRYINNWSLGLDARILFKTVAVVFKHKGAK
ncbi:sugar transferase [Galactobacillus timonensis]|uniref:sugar transferase n=1 Tax=Galactobacillus timonensis TaxID=2041840 RepID=UPI0023F227F3|nr:sugar transferase [Galactobacillus timonensis]MCI6754595.1 sugar transferase [Galactobacillus timonensis]